MAPIIELTADLDGYAIRFRGEVLAIRPTWDQAVGILKVARVALAQVLAEAA